MSTSGPSLPSHAQVQNTSSRSDSTCRVQALHSTGSRASRRSEHRTPALWGPRPARPQPNLGDLRERQGKLRARKFPPGVCIRATCIWLFEIHRAEGSPEQPTKSTTQLDLMALVAPVFGGLARHQLCPKDLCARLSLGAPFLHAHSSGPTSCGFDRLSGSRIGHLLRQQLHLTKGPGLWQVFLAPTAAPTLACLSSSTMSRSSHPGARTFRGNISHSHGA